MGISAHFRLSKSLNLDEFERLGLTNATIDELGRVTIYELGVSDWRAVLDCLKKQDASVRTRPYVFIPEDEQWNQDSTIFGGVLSPTFTTRLVGRSGCTTETPVILDVCDHPDSDHGVCEDTEIFSSQLINALPGLVRESQVSFKGKTTPWFSIQCPVTRSVFDDHSFQGEINCAICGTRYVPRTGVWLASQPIEDNEIVQSIKGIAHSGLRRPIVVGVNLADRLQYQFRRLYVEPVFDLNSPIGELVAEFNQCIADLHE